MTIDCEHWKACGVNGGGCCSLGLFGGKPSHGTCMWCQNNRSPNQPVPLVIESKSQPTKIPLAGDLVAAAAKRIGADRLAKLWEKWTGKPCGCAERKERMNRATERLLKWLRAA